ncbi:Holliday junction resolvase RuvX [Pumilibacter muris]|uniref:Holliday junction resolvase RuvX n=1 Tax=Pumilibacter muris TaxID=2941510 RepID=UPI00203BEF3C|nr:Holliday junction resolvase RuvX [Pumilibacter muris]
MRILAIDYGDARIGLALSDESETLASPLETYKSQSMRKDIDAIAALAKEKDAGLIVLGLPINMDGSHGERANKTESFGKVLEKVSGLKVVYKDERLTTVSAEKTLIECNMRREKRKQVIDTLSAQIILQSYLDAQKRIK